MRLLIVSNRLPVTANFKEGEFHFKKSVGGLSTGLSSYLKTIQNTDDEISEYVWLGWPGMSVESTQQEKFKEKLFEEAQAYPVFLSDKTVEKFYHGFSNKTLWPLFHFFSQYTVFEEESWQEYQKVNQQFCAEVIKILQPGDVVWVQDYQLMLLPAMIRKLRPDICIGFFLHIPFPSFETFRILPNKWRKVLLEGLLGADLIGFHTHDYTQAFLRCVLRILGYEHNMGQIVYGDRVLKVDTFPMGIDFEAFEKGVLSAEVALEKEKFIPSLKNFKLILSVDRLDYTKGILNRLQGYEKFLEHDPKWHKQVVLVLVLVPSRTEVDQYQEMKKQIDEYIGRINGRFGSIDWAPVIYLYRSFDVTALMALYHLSEIALITPLRDGMNLIAKEYLACRSDGRGVLILSEMAGAAQELGEAVIINPNSEQEIAEAIQAALEMPSQEQVKRNRLMQERLRQYNVTRWAGDFLFELSEIKKIEKKFHAKVMNLSLRQEIIAKFKKAKNRLLLLDYDGTLVPFSSHPDLSQPGEALFILLNQLAENHANNLVMISGRSKSVLQAWFGCLEMDLVAEHGAWIKQRNEEWRLLKILKNDWKPQLFSILKIYSDRLPGSFVEEKEYSLVWHYRKADPELASLREKELMDDLVSFTATADLQILPGNKIVEIRNAGVSKGNAALDLITKKDYDFILAIGDDHTDEDLFHALPEMAYSIRVGITNSFAKSNFASHLNVLQFLQALAEGE